MYLQRSMHVCQHIANTEMCVLLAEKFENYIQAVGEPQMCSFIIFFSVWAPVSSSFPVLIELSVSKAPRVSKIQWTRLGIFCRENSSSNCVIVSNFPVAWHTTCFCAANLMEVMQFASSFFPSLSQFFQLMERECLGFIFIPPSFHQAQTLSWITPNRIRTHMVS